MMIYENPVINQHEKGMLTTLQLQLDQIYENKARGGLC